MTGSPTQESICPGCGLRMPVDPRLQYDGYFNCSAECYDIFAEVLARDYTTPYIFGNVHQTTVDAYAVQHAGGPHPDKSIAVHLLGLYLALERGLPAPAIAPYMQRLASIVTAWPHFPPPAVTGAPTIFDIALTGDPETHVARVRQWAAAVWEAWSPHHGAIATLTHRYLPEVQT